MSIEAGEIRDTLSEEEEKEIRGEITAIVHKFFNKQIDQPWYKTILNVVEYSFAITFLWFCFMLVEIVAIPVIRIFDGIERIIKHFTKKEN